MLCECEYVSIGLDPLSEGPRASSTETVVVIVYVHPEQHQ